MDYRREDLVNEQGTCYGEQYTILVAPGEDEFRLQQELILTVIGEDYYYGPRQVFEQVRIEFEHTN